MRNLRLLVLLSFLGAPLHAASAQSYHLTDLGILDGYSASFGYGVSDSGGYVSGWLEGSGGTRAFRWSSSSGIEVLPIGAGMTGSRAFGVNDRGVVAGESVLSASQREATLWDPLSGRLGLGTLPNPSNPNRSSVAFGVNNAGLAVGWSDAEEGTPFHLDSKDPSIPVAEFIASEARFAILARTNPARAAELGALLQADADERWRFYSQLATVRRSLPHTVEAVAAGLSVLELPTTAGPDEMAVVK